MPIVPPNSNHRIPPPNARSGDVARATLAAVIPAQNRKYHEAFRVNGYEGVLYTYLTSGVRCACQSKARAINSRLNEEGKASTGAINQMILGVPFGISDYGSSIPNTEAYEERKTEGSSLLEVTLNQRTPLAQPTNEGPLQIGGLPPKQGTNTSLGINNFDEIIDDDSDLEDAQSGNDIGLLGYSDVSCPVCFGSGFLGGYGVLNGYRKVVNFQDSGLQLPPEAVISVEKYIPSIWTKQVQWTIVFPAGCVSIDAFRVWNGTRLVVPNQIRIDGTLVTSQAQVMTYCDGRPHAVRFNWSSEVDITHFEFQVNLSTESVYFELPRLSKNSVQNLREATNPFSVNLSPIVPHIKALDVIVESTFGKALHVKDVTGWNERKYSSLGWDVEVRPTQPMELFYMLPRRKLVKTLHKEPFAVGPTGTQTLQTNKSGIST